MDKRAKIFTYLEKQRDGRKQKLLEISKQIHQISRLRVTIFLLTVVGIYFFTTIGFQVIIPLSIIGFGLFGFLVNRHQTLEKQKQKIETLLEISRQEIRLFYGNTEGKPDGSYFVDAGHPYAADLDIFGKRSIFQLIDRSATMEGQRRLSHSLKIPITETLTIKQRQQAIAELSPKAEWRQAFQAGGILSDEADNDVADLMLWAQQNKAIFNKAFYHILLWLNPILGFGVIALIAYGVLNIITFIFFLLLPLVIVGSRISTINKEHFILSKKALFLKKTGILLQHIETEDFSSEILVFARNSLTGSTDSASAAFKKLGKIAKVFDYRLNILIGIFLNIFFLWDILQSIRLERWKKMHAQTLTQWFDALALVDELCSFAGFDFLQADSVFPQISTKDFFIDGEELKHPFIVPEKCVGNPVRFTDWKQFQIITGANMAGKSTYLRTVGVNMVLAMAGSSVPAKRFVFSPVNIFTGIKTKDSLQDGESYFFAELKQLRKIIIALQSGKKVFIILDEILKGTNSADKQNGSKALVKQLISLGASGVIATHDLALGELSKNFPENVINKRFEVEIENNRLVFDYKLKEGVSQNLNATFLMKKMGITV